MKTETIAFQIALPMPERYHRLAEELAVARMSTPEEVVASLAGKHLQAVLDLVCSELEQWGVKRN